MYTPFPSLIRAYLEPIHEIFIVIIIVRDCYCPHRRFGLFTLHAMHDGRDVRLPWRETGPRAGTVLAAGGCASVSD